MRTDPSWRSGVIGNDPGMATDDTRGQLMMASLQTIAPKDRPSPDPLSHTRKGPGLRSQGESFVDSQQTRKIVLFSEKPIWKCMVTGNKESTMIIRLLNVIHLYTQASLLFPGSGTHRLWNGDSL